MTLSVNYCDACDIEFKIQHDADKNLFTVLHCPFCGTELDVEEHYDFDDTEEE